MKPSLRLTLIIGLLFCCALLNASQSTPERIASWALKFWDPATGREIPGLNAGIIAVESIAFGPDGKLAAIAVESRDVDLAG